MLSCMWQVEDLFYSLPLRQKLLKPPAEEYSKIIDICRRYALHFPGISVSCKKVRCETAHLIVFF